MSQLDYHVAKRLQVILQDLEYREVQRAARARHTVYPVASRAGCGPAEELRPTNSPSAISAGSLLPSLILGLEHPGSLTGDTHLCSGLVVLLSPIQNTSCPFAGLWF